MSESEQIDALVSDLNKVIDRYRAEFNLTVAATIGVLECIKLDLWKEHADQRDSE